MTTTSNTSKLVSAAILFGDMKGSATLAEEDEDSTVQQLREYRDFTRQTVAGFGASFYKVKFEGDGFMAVFDTAHEMVTCGFKLQQEFRRRGWLIRLGGSFGAVYRDEGGDVDGADVNRAARIQQSADALTCEFLVSKTVEQIVRKRLKEVCFLPHDPVEAKGIAEPLEVCAVAPATEKQAPQRITTKVVRALPVAPVPRSWKLATLATIPLLAGFLLWYVAVPPPPPPPPPPNPETVAVLEFENQKFDDAANGWYSRAIQTNLTTKLNDIEELEVITLSFIVKKARDEGVDLLEAARRLQVGQVVTGSYAVDSDQIRIDASIIDTDKGLQKAAGSVKGARIDFFGLQDNLSETLCDKFNVQLSQTQKAKFETASIETAKKSKTAKKSAVDKYRLLLEGEGVTSSAPAAQPEPKPEPQAGISQGPSWAEIEMSRVLVPAALAQGGAFATEEEVRQFLERYRSAYESGDVARLASLYVAFPETQLRSVKAYMSSIDDLHVELADVDIQIGDNDAAVTYTRRDTFVDKETEEELSLEVRLTRFLARQGEELKFASAE